MFRPMGLTLRAGSLRYVASIYAAPYRACASRRPPYNRTVPPRLVFAGHAMKVFFVLGADRLQEIAIHKQLGVNCNRPRFGIRLGVVECDLNVQVPEVSATEPFGHPQRVG